MKGVTLYSGIARFYFHHLLRQIVRVGQLNRPSISILDFGCGQGMLKRMLPDRRVIGYDIIPELSDIQDWQNTEFDVLVANEVFYSFAEHELDDLLVALQMKNPRLELVVGISRQGWLNNVGKYLLGRPDAHSRTKIGPQTEMEILQRHCVLERKKNVLNLANVCFFRFK